MDNFKLTPSVFREITPKIDSNKKYINNVNQIKYNTGQPLNKYWTFDFIELISDYIDFDEVKTIFDVGSRDGYQSVEFRNWFPNAKIVAFEANPNQIPECLSVTHGHNIEIVNKAAGNVSGPTTFNISWMNIGASSLLKISNHSRSSEWKQIELKVDMVRIDNWCEENKIESIDLLWVDVQGAEKIVFDGCGDLLNSVKAIYTEVELSHMYNGSILKEELDMYLTEKGFIPVQTYHMGDKVKSFEELANTIGECDVIYINKKYINGKV